MKFILNSVSMTEPLNFWNMQMKYIGVV